MNVQYEIFHPAWWCFSSYEIRDGFIRPAPEAPLKTYEPGEVYADQSDDARKKLVPPYQPLFDLLHVLDGTPATDHNEAIVEWCNQYGLLGLLPHLSHFSLVWPRYELIPYQHLPHMDVAKDCHAVQHSYSRDHGGWISTRADRLNDSFPAEHAGQAVSPKIAKVFRTPGVLFEELDGTRQWQGFTRSWKQFFPSVRKDQSETYDYPLPTTERFWREYSEPVEDFLKAARLLLSAVKDHNEGDPRGLAALQRLINPISVSFEHSPNRAPEMRWKSPSLLATYSMMAMLDFNSDWRLLKCKRCGRLFASRAYQAAYCGPPCQHTAIKRDYRKRLKEREAAKARRRRAKSR